MRYGIFFLALIGFSLFCSSFTVSQGPPPWMREGGGPPGGPPPWMREGGGPSGGPPPWMRGAGENGPSRRDGRQRGPDRAGGNDNERNERTIGMLRAMDRNGNGKLEQDEIPEYRRAFVQRMVTRLGGDPNKTIDLNNLARKAAGGSSASGTSAKTGATGLNLASDPLVPYFGESEEQAATVPAFGQREPETKKATTTAAPPADTLSQSDRILRSAREIMNKYDKNKNGTLDKDKNEWNTTLPFKPDPADKNRDGRISMTELIDALGGTSGTSTGAAAVSTRQSIPYERLPQGVPDWFFERDKDENGQLTMLEYANNQPWTEAMADEFRFLDKNNDGVATVAEVFETLKQVDEEKRLKEEKAKREQERKKGAGAPISGDQPKDEKKPDEPAGSGPAPPADGPGPKPDPTGKPPGPGPGPGPGQNTPDGPGPNATNAPSIPTTGPYATGSDTSKQKRPGANRPSRRKR